MIIYLASQRDLRWETAIRWYDGYESAGDRITISADTPEWQYSDTSHGTFLSQHSFFDSNFIIASLFAESHTSCGPPPCNAIEGGQTSVYATFTVDQPSPFRFSGTTIKSEVTLEVVGAPGWISRNIQDEGTWDVTGTFVPGETYQLFSGSGASSWEPHYEETSYSLVLIPDPSTIVLTFLGLVALAWKRIWKH